MIYRRRNDIAVASEPDTEVRQLNNAKEEPDNTGEKTQQIKALILRCADLSHYKAFDDIGFILDAVGRRDYEGSPALDVLPSHEDIDQERREKVKEYIYCLSSWANGTNIEDAVAEFKANEKLLRNTYMRLGDPDDQKKSLAECLIGLLADRVSSPEDAISEVSDEEFVSCVYKTVLRREPDEDDLSLRLMELRRGKSRQELIRDILESRESNRRMIVEIAESIKQFAGN